MIKITKHRLRGYPKFYHTWGISFVGWQRIILDFNKTSITIHLGGKK